MKTFINTSPEESRDIHRVVFVNARQLKRDALILAKNKSYNSSTSLLILSSEELIKAIYILLHSQKYDVYKIKGAKKIFSDHKIRHNTTRLIEVGLGFMEVFDFSKEKKSIRSIKTNIKWLDSIANSILKLNELSKPFVKMIERDELLESFNDIKNRGLYTDYFNRVFIPQREVVLSDYRKVLNLVNRMFRFYKFLNLLFHSELYRHYPDNEISEFKNELRISVNDILRGKPRSNAK